MRVLTSEENALVVERVAPALPGEGALEPGEVVVGRLAHDVTVKLTFRWQRIGVISKELQDRASLKNGF